MALFEIDESLNFRGGNFYSSVYANTVDEVVEELKDAWYSSGIHRHGGELFLNAVLHDANGGKVSLYLGSCTVDKKENLYSAFEFPYYEDDKERWHCLGLFAEDFGNDEVESVIEVILESDTPNRVLGAYLYRLSRLHAKNRISDQKNYGKIILANVLDFARVHKKTHEMYQWLCSDEGVNYLQNNDLFATASLALLSAIEAESVENFDDFIAKNQKDFGVKIALPSELGD